MQFNSVFWVNSRKSEDAYNNIIKGFDSVKIKEVVAALERFAPLPLQEDWDNAGLQVGLTETEVSGALLCLDVTEAVVDEAVSNGLNLIVSHHPLLFRKLRSITGADEVQRCVIKALKNDITILSMHTNMDNALGGVNYKIAEKMGLNDVRFFAAKEQNGIECGSGTIGTLPAPMDSSAFISMLKERFQVESVQTNELLKRKIERVAICGGSGAFLLGDAISEKADAFLTGEMHYHEFFDHEQQIQICVIGHYQSEQYTAEVFRDIIAKACPQVRTQITTINTNPIKYL